MTVTQLAADPMDALVARIGEEVRRAIATPDLSAVHEVIRAAGIRNARTALAVAPERLSEAQAAYRIAQAAEGLARESYTTALLEAEWELDGQIHSDGNKRYRWIACDCDDLTDCPVCKGTSTYRQNMLADDVKAWKAAESARVPGVVLVAAELRRAEGETAAARDAVLVAEKSLSVRRADLEAAVAELNALAIGLSARGA